MKGATEGVSKGGTVSCNPPPGAASLPVGHFLVVGSRSEGPAAAREGLPREADHGSCSSSCQL